MQKLANTPLLPSAGADRIQLDETSGCAVRS